MVKRDAMVQLQDDNAEYPFLHVHTQDGDDVDPLTRQVVNPTKGYAQKNSFLQTGDDNAEYPFLHVHTQDGEDVDPLTRQVVNPTKGYAQKNENQMFGKQLKRIVAIWK